MTVEQEIKAIDKEIGKLHRERSDLRRGWIADFQEAHKPTIGRCFLNRSGEYVMITDVPPAKEKMSGLDFNQYQFPCRYLASEEDLDMPVPFWDDTAYTSDGETFGVPPASDRPAWEEIS